MDQEEGIMFGQFLTTLVIGEEADMESGNTLRSTTGICFKSGILEARSIAMVGARYLVGKGDIDIWSTPWVPGFTPDEGWKGAFSVTGAYWLSQHERFQQEKPVWKALWKLKLHPRHILMIWRILSACLPLKSRLGFLNHSDRLCAFSGEQDEIEFHLFCIFPFARGIYDDHLERTLAFVLEAICLCRNKLVFCSSSPSLEDSIRLISKRAMEFSMLAEANNSYDPHVIIDPAHLIGIVVKKPGAADYESCQSFCSVSNVLEAYLVAILSALEYAWDARIQSVVIPSDSNIAVDALNLRELPTAAA
ncbi:hypothetical protein G4B88_030241 [Cannabis sativa]|uniref:RNase H type-1 domain-containing protein n=1 Tax=Cannabis sativa TaxID=3483 RepID=A0A7J6EDM6_CANSA|nr:hypothetical protein G4B88_030241 [Cannabis sativa]